MKHGMGENMFFIHVLLGPGWKRGMGDLVDWSYQLTFVQLAVFLRASPNAYTISLFKDGKRACEPQPLPDNLHGKALYPTINYRH